MERRDVMTAAMTAAAAGLGAGAAYLWDPTNGKRRRHELRQQGGHALRQFEAFFEAGTRDLEQRGRGQLHEWTARLTEETPDDAALIDRVRATLGRVVSHPRAIHVSACQGTVTLTGHIFRREAAPLLKAVKHVRGVQNVTDQLERHKHASRVAELQGAAPMGRPGHRRKLWSPGFRLVCASLSSGAVATGLKRGGVLGTTTAATGGLYLLRSATNLEFSRLLGLKGRRGIDFRKSMNIQAPVTEVYRFWSDYRNFPRVFRNVKDVRLGRNGISHWTVRGPAGIDVHWDARETARRHGEVIAWQSVTHAPVRHSGVIRFTENPDRSTRLDIRLTYNPPVGAIGHAIALLFGKDPKHELDVDLVRLKTRLETGKWPRAREA